MNQTGQTGKQGMSKCHGLLEHPRAENDENQNNADQFGDKDQRGFVDLGCGLNQTDQTADQQADQ
jgi:hypothetical protein